MVTLVNLNGMEVTGIDNRKKEKGMTLLEALVSTAIIGIGFVAVFQMVNYSVQSIDVSGERTKANYLVSMVAEDLIAEKNSDSPTSNVKFMDYLVSNKSGGKSWNMGACSSGSSSTGNFTNVTQNKFEKWDSRFSKRRIKCKGPQDTKFLKVFDICNNNASGNTCNYNNTRNYSGTGIYDKWIVGKMEVNLNGGKKKKFLYFQIN